MNYSVIMHVLVTHEILLQRNVIIMGIHQFFHWGLMETCVFSLLSRSTFLNNTSEGDTQDTSAIAAFRFPTVFSGSSLFEGNIGGGITLLNTRMQVRAFSNLLFLNNRAVFGGGISMDDRCLVSEGSIGRGGGLHG